jgi:hypothetical protein
MAREVGVTASSVHTIWKQNELKPHLTGSFKISNDPQFEEKFWDVIVRVKRYPMTNQSSDRYVAGFLMARWLRERG